MNGYKITCDKCNAVVLYRNETEYLDNVPDSIHYCKRCGAPSLPNNISRCNYTAEAKKLPKKIKTR